MTSSDVPSSAPIRAASSAVATRPAVGDDRHVRPGGHHGGAVQGASEQRCRVVDVALLPVAALRLEEDDGIVRRNGLLDHAVPVGCVAGRHDAEAGGVGEVGLRRLGVVLDRADPTAVGDPDRHRHGHPALVAVAQLGHLRHDLVEGRVDEPVELDLAHRTVAPHGQPDRGADDARLGDRRVDHAAFAEVLLQAFGDPEHASELADVLTHQHDLGVALHRLAQAHVERLAQ